MSEQHNTLKPGTRLKSPKREYVIEKVLGQGGFGITYKAVWATKIENVPVKIYFAVKEFFMSDSCERDESNNSRVVYSTPVKNKVEESRRDFISEATRLNSLSKDHPSIVRVNEVFEANNTAYYVMEFLEGGSLRNHVRQNGAMTEKEALNVMLPVIDAVSTLHQSKITHLDIKPDNIMLKPNAEGGMTPVLIDFGLSKHYDNKGNPTSTIRAVGISAGYAPMEQYTGITTFTPQADVYGLGATLYYLLVGRDPAIASDIRPDMIESALPESVSPTVREALLGAMKMFKNERTQSAAEFGKNLSKKGAAVKKEQPKPEKRETSETVVITPEGNIGGSGNGSGGNGGYADNYGSHTVTGGDGDNYIHRSEEVTPIVRKNLKPLWIGLGVVAAVILIILLMPGKKGDNKPEEATEIYVENETFHDNEFDKDFIYTGQMTGDSLPNGEGKAIYTDGTKYEGSFVQGMRHGQGVYTYINGDRFEGVFENNHLSEGKYFAESGAYFEGKFKKDVPWEGSWHDTDGTITNISGERNDSI